MPVSSTIPSGYRARFPGAVRATGKTSLAHKRAGWLDLNLAGCAAPCSRRSRAYSATRVAPASCSISDKRPSNSLKTPRGCHILQIEANSATPFRQVQHIQKSSSTNALATRVFPLIPPPCSSFCNWTALSYATSGINSVRDFCVGFYSTYCCLLFLGGSFAISQRAYVGMLEIAATVAAK